MRIEVLLKDLIMQINQDKTSLKAIALFTTNLELRRAKNYDLINLFENYCGDAYCSRYLMRGRHTSLHQTQIFLETWCGSAWHIEGKSFAWVIADKYTDQAIGAFTLIQENPIMEIHFGIAQHYWGRGLLVEAGMAVITWLATQYAGRIICTMCDRENLRSSRVLEKLGFIRDEQQQKYVVMPECGPEPRCCWVYQRTI